MKTESESLFEAFCHTQSVHCSVVPTASETAEQRPDYEARASNGRKVYFEIKQFDPNPTERAALEAAIAAKPVTFQTTPGERIRNAIAKAAPQLRALAQGTSPAVVVVYNNVLSSHLHTDPYAVLTAMRGLDTISVSVPRDPALSPTFGPMRPGPRKKLTESANTSISAIAVLYRDESDVPALAVYHNPFAKIPLREGDLPIAQVKHFRMADDQSGWESYSPAV